MEADQTVSFWLNPAYKTHFHQQLKYLILNDYLPAFSMFPLTMTRVSPKQFVSLFVDFFDTKVCPIH